ncbi:MAG: hypothetical protein ACRDDY_03810 [Clostridium sp.]|uniref:hypothetical protein n=1 Tax=Clostridium sp. TaxID=1506 RepID=UPI003EE68E44
MDFYIDEKNRRVVIGNVKSRSAIVINEFDKLEKNFLATTKDKYECELVLLEVEVRDENDEITGAETKAFARRVGCEQWLMEFDTENYRKK